MRSTKVKASGHPPVSNDSSPKKLQGSNRYGSNSNTFSLSNGFSSLAKRNQREGGDSLTVNKQSSLDATAKSREKSTFGGESPQVHQLTTMLNQLNQDIQEELYNTEPEAKENRKESVSKQKDGESASQSPTSMANRMKKDMYESSKAILPANVLSDLYKVKDGNPKKDKISSTASEGFNARLSVGFKKNEGNNSKIKEDLKSFKQNLKKVKNDFGIGTTKHYPKSEHELPFYSQRPGLTSPSKIPGRGSLKKESSPPLRMSLNSNQIKQMQNVTERTRKKSSLNEKPSTKREASSSKRGSNSVKVETAELIKELDALYSKLRDRIVNAAGSNGKSEFLKANVDVLLGHMESTLQSFLRLNQSK